MQIYCITHKKINGIKELGLIPFGVGQSTYPSNYITENSGENIAYKNHNYSETSFHYWYWKNILPKKNDNDWFGMCQYRRYFVKKEYGDDIQNTFGKQGYYPHIKNFNDLENMLQKIRCGGTKPKSRGNCLGLSNLQLLCFRIIFIAINKLGVESVTFLWAVFH